MDENQLAILISDIVQNTPAETVQEIAAAIEAWPDPFTDIQRLHLLSLTHAHSVKSRLKRLLTLWGTNYPHLSAFSLALSIRAALLAFHASRTTLELVWTGPDALPTNLRRTDQALLELINGAKERLLIVSFAVYKAQTILDAIEKALLRNIQVIICLEDAEASQGKLSFSGFRSFSGTAFRLASFYTWPIEKRTRATDGSYGSLHAKLAVADCRTAFISSANLTDYAMDLNMEMGILVDDRSLAGQIDNLFTQMIANSTLQKIP